MTLEFRAFDDRRDLAQQRHLFELAFPEQRDMPAASEEHYRWKFHGFPAPRPSYEYAASEGGRLVGYYGAIPYPYQIGGRRMTVGMVCDVMTHPEARGKGVFTELGSFALHEMEAAELDFVSGYPVRREVMGGHLRAGWTIAFEMPMYLQPLKADGILRTRKLGVLAPAANLAIAACRRLRFGGSARRRYTVTSGSPGEILTSDAFERFIESWAESVPNHLVKSAAFYRWRLGAPSVDYRVFLAYCDGAVVAAAIGRAAVLNGIPSYALLDAMVRAGCEDALATLYRDVEREAREQNAEAVVTMMTRSSAQRYRLIRAGFLRSPFVFKLILRSTSALPIASISHEADWHLMWIDSDDL